ncbi:NADP-dependent oxidoreductase [Microbacterium rhizomatis]|uniref:NADP-dependent oxidoreductase n=1 Tax=Microbacterium rhizomatis TaxID=1631477 RepID=A0A5J5J085_9MICO|nr:NADP-dependent oxidoreductase [Microbacterium rhizomatis]KAA9107717.1 NADP-dependent oxidoreductase [Microbacterium rhizomatis]
MDATRGTAMKAVVMVDYGGLEVLRIADLDAPVPEAHEVLVEVHAASINGADVKLRSGATRYDQMSFPHIMGRDFAGVVRKAPFGSDLRVGQDVYGVCQRGTDGGQAEQIAIEAAIVAPMPPGIDHTQAAAIALTGLTALYALDDVGGVSAGQRVLVQGGAGGVGSFAVQLAKHLGADVTTTASAANHEYVRSLGADEVIDYRATDVADLGRRFDLVFDTVGGDVQRGSAAVVRPGGALVHCAAGPEASSPSRSDIAVIRPEVVRDRAHLERISDLIGAGAVRPPAITRFPMADVAEAHRLSEGRHLQGKLVLEMR